MLSLVVSLRHLVTIVMHVSSYAIAPSRVTLDNPDTDSVCPPRRMIGWVKFTGA
jgi:hypothetical protein